MQKPFTGSELRRAIAEALATPAVESPAAQGVKPEKAPSAALAIVADDEAAIVSQARTELALLSDIAHSVRNAMAGLLILIECCKIAHPSLLVELKHWLSYVPREDINEITSSSHAKVVLEKVQLCGMLLIGWNSKFDLAGFSRDLKSTIPAEAKERALIRDAIASIDSYSGVIKSVLLKLEHGEVVEEININALIKWLLTHNPPQVILELDENLPAIRGLRVTLLQMLDNLFDNARAAIAHKQGGWIKVTSQAVENNIVITVEDNGCGIAEGNKGRIFTPKFTTKSYGSGLGLPFVRTAVEIHKGQITFASEEGQGTTFTIALPFEKNDPAVAALFPAMLPKIMGTFLFLALALVAGALYFSAVAAAPKLFACAVMPLALCGVDPLELVIGLSCVFVGMCVNPGRTVQPQHQGQQINEKKKIARAFVLTRALAKGKGLCDFHCVLFRQILFRIGIVSR